MVRWAEGIARESIALVDGIIQRPPPDQEVVHSTTIHEYEIKIHKVSTQFIIGREHLLSLCLRSCTSSLHQLNSFRSK